MEVVDGLMLPSEIWSHVFSFMEIRSLIISGLVCKFFNELSNYSSLWKDIFIAEKFRIFWLPNAKKQLIESNDKIDWKEMVLFWYQLKNAKDKPDDIATGIFCATDVNEGSVYRGEFLNGQKHGRGINRWKTQLYEGQWLNGKRCGFGSYLYLDGRRFIGHHMNDKRICGKFYWPAQGSTYDGEYMNGVRHGRGIFTWKSGDSYDGYFKEGGRSGTGLLTIVAGANKGQYIQEWDEKSFNFNNLGSLGERKSAPVHVQIESKRKFVEDLEDNRLQKFAKVK